MNCSSVSVGTEQLIVVLYTYTAYIHRQDEVGTPYRIIVDEKTLETGIVSLQDRDTSAVVLQMLCVFSFGHSLAFLSGHSLL